MSGKHRLALQHVPCLLTSEAKMNVGKTSPMHWPSCKPMHLLCCMSFSCSALYHVMVSPFQVPTFCCATCRQLRLMHLPRPQALHPLQPPQPPPQRQHQVQSPHLPVPWLSHHHQRQQQLQRQLLQRRQQQLHQLLPL